MLRIFGSVILFVLLGTGMVAAETITGRVQVTDADTFRVGAVKVRLFGIDAPEVAQACELADGRPWRCGQWAKERARTLYQGAWATCQRRDTDKYGRAVATCRIDGMDVGRRLVRDGLAEAYRKYALDYVDDEKAAWFQSVGLWRGRVQAPAEFRAVKAKAPPPPDTRCAIKGNISANGRIYHMPYQRDYGRTHIRLAKGEHWFCSEAEALTAGWRRALR
jgi:endonuclease YncB( thermonuclease family)